MLLSTALLGAPFFPAAGAAAEAVEAAFVKNLSPEEASAWIRENESRGDVVLLDVRTPQEYSGERIAGAVLIDYLSGTFREELERMDRGKRYLVYCRTGNRSEKAVTLMKELRFREIRHLSGGIVKWKDAGLPTAR
jgi:rhodanese-related sulfurtransferase